MNKLTRKIKDKGYSLPEFCFAHGISLRTYRSYENTSNKNHEKLNKWINDLPSASSLTGNEEVFTKAQVARLIKLINDELKEK